MAKFKKYVPGITEWLIQEGIVTDDKGGKKGSRTEDIDAEDLDLDLDLGGDDEDGDNA